MPRPGRGPGNFEKSKDFKGSMLRLVKNLRSWKVIMLMALGLAMASAILALIAPNKLSDFADLIGEGLTPNVEVIEDIGKKINNNLSGDKIKTKLALMHTSSSISIEDYDSARGILGSLNNVSTPEEGMALMLQLPDSILMYLLDEIEVEGVIISV